LPYAPTGNSKNEFPPEEAQMSLSKYKATVGIER
jgi:hypothetical protein